jgi:hypothetical protein
MINMSMGKVIHFPSERTTAVQQEITDFYENEVAKQFIEDFIDKVGHGLVNEFYNNGYDVDDERFVLQFMYSLEIMKSVLYDNKGMEHQLTEFVTKHASQYFQSEVIESDE